MAGLLDEDSPGENERQAKSKPTYTDGGPPYTTLPSGVVVDKNGKPYVLIHILTKSITKELTYISQMPDMYFICRMEVNDEINGSIWQASIF